MCDFCSSSDSSFIVMNKDTVKYSNLEIAMDNSGTLRVRHLYDVVRNNQLVQGFDTQDVLNIAFCPICGKAINKQ